MNIEIINSKFVITDFDEFEAYRIGSKIEEDGIYFYKNCLNRVTTAAAKEAIEFLIGEEKSHLKFFQDCLYELRQEKEDSSEENDLLTSLDYGIFNLAFNPVKSSKKDQLLQTIAFAIEIEDRSIEFYQAVQASVKGPDVKVQLSRIVKEETRHKAILKGLAI
ncbi:MAG: ferritin family protein [Candidatus Omnitrophica bacterium]|nr:ferritin family protein [Candidatus Omnitrophota bacterium]